MKASYLGAMGYSQRYNFPTTWPIPPIYHDPETSVRSYQEGIEECEFAEEMGFEWVSFSEHHYSGRIATGTPAVMAAAVAERCKKVKIAMLGHLLTLNNPIRVAEELGLLDNLTNGRLVIGFLRGTPNEDQTYSVNPSEGPGAALGGHGPGHQGADRAPALLLGRALLPVPHRRRLAAAGPAAPAADGGGDQERRHAPLRCRAQAGPGSVLRPCRPDGQGR